MEQIVIFVHVVVARFKFYITLNTPYVTTKHGLPYNPKSLNSSFKQQRASFVESAN